MGREGGGVVIILYLDLFLLCSVIDLHIYLLIPVCLYACACVSSIDLFVFLMLICLF